MRAERQNILRWLLAAALLGSLVVLALFWLRPERPAANFLWQLSRADGRQLYIAGSIHLARPELYPLNQTFDQAFEQASALVVELDTTGLSQSELNSFIMDRGVSTDPRALSQRLSPQTASLLADSGFYSWEMERFEPWLAALVIQSGALELQGFLPEYGLDLYFIRRARQLGLTVLELETPSEQLSLMADMSPEESDLFLRATLMELNELPRILNKFFRAWRTGDTESFGEIFFEEYERYPELKPLLEKVILQRNRQMAQRLELLISQYPAPLFVVVGGGHLVGQGSLLELLAASGFSVHQL